MQAWTGLPFMETSKLPCSPICRTFYRRYYIKLPRWMLTHISEVWLIPEWLITERLITPFAVWFERILMQFKPCWQIHGKWLVSHMTDDFYISLWHTFYPKVNNIAVEDFCFVKRKLDGISQRKSRFTKICPIIHSLKPQWTVVS